MEQKVKVLAADQVKIHRPDPNERDNHYAPRNRIYVRDVKGSLEWFRRSFGFILLALFILIPWLQFNGEQAVLLDIGNQRFRIFGMTLWPQDLTILAWIAIVAAFALFFVTTLYGRVWCGFMCPQTTWTFIFMWFEKKIEGSRNQRMTLDRRPWDANKVMRKVAKHTSWLLVALFTALIFVGYDYAINNVFSFNSPIRIMSNSWGSSGKFSPDDPVSIASYKAYKLGIMSVFAAGNSGPGEDSHNPYAQIPWGMSVGAGDKFGNLAGFSSRGLKGESGSFTMPDNTEWTYNNEVSIVAPGVNIISTRASTNLVANGGDADIEAIETEYLPFYTMISGTSMATPHVAGIIALMMEANPDLSILEIKQLVQETATNMPGFEKWEVGGGYINAKAAVAAALGENLDYASSVNNLNTFNANAITISSDRVEPFEVLYSPVGEPETFSFEVGNDVTWVKASAENLANTTKLVLVAPDGTEFSGNLTLPALDTGMRVAAPGQSGTWQLYVFGLTSLSGVNPDPLGLTNGPGVPEVVSGQVSFELGGGYEGVDDIEGHPLQNAIEFAVSERLVDGFSNGKFRPDRTILRQDLSQYLVMGAAIRQYRDLLNEDQLELFNVPGEYTAVANAVSATGGALKDNAQTQAPVLESTNGNFEPRGTVSKLDLAYTLVQVLGLEDVARSFDPEQDIVVNYRDNSIVLADQDEIPADRKGYVQLAIQLSLLNVDFTVEQGPFDLQPQLTASFSPEQEMTRAGYALTAGRLYSQYLGSL